MLLHRKMLEDLSRRLSVCVFHGVGGGEWVGMGEIVRSPSGLKFLSSRRNNVTDVELNQSNHVRSVEEIFYSCVTLEFI